MSIKHCVIDTIDYQSYCKRNIFIRQILPLSSADGFLLWELMVGLSVMMIGMISLYHWHALTIKTYQQAFKRMEMILFAINERKKDIRNDCGNVICSRTVCQYNMQSLKSVFQTEYVPDLQIECVSMHHKLDNQCRLKILHLLS